MRVYYETVTNARRRQLAARASRPINRRRTSSTSAPRGLRPVEGPLELWRSPAFAIADRAADGILEGTIDLLGLTIPYPPSDWRQPKLEALRRFHLHYGDEILGCARRGDARYLSAARGGLAAWLGANPPATQPAWHPYPLSTRVGNWVAAASLEPSLASDAVNESLWRQLAYLERNIEDDILGNHVIRNARALVLGGVAFGAEGLLTRGLGLLARELPEQILPDGGHYERSPVYHALVLRDLLEVRAAAGTSELDSTIERMEKFAAWLSRPDGHPALFNDGGLDLAPDLRDRLPKPKRELALFENTGYAVVRDDPFWLVFDCGLAAPPFLPPHAHADALSFQLWVGGTPVVVDPGTFTYEPGLERDWFRGTPAHATIAVDGGDQFQLVGAFRALGIPRVHIVEVSGSEREGTITAEVHGFRHVAGGVRHRRRLSWSSEEISVEDWLDGHGNHVLETALPLAPGIDVQNGSALRAGGVAIEPIGPLTCTVEERWVSERFFDRIPAPAVVARGEVRLPVELGWKLRLLEGASTWR